MKSRTELRKAAGRRANLQKRAVRGSCSGKGPRARTELGCLLVGCLDFNVLALHGRSIVVKR